MEVTQKKHKSTYIKEASVISKDSIPRPPVLARNTFLNLLGSVLPLATAVVAMPQLIRELGTERFGVLSLIWIVIGYFGLFDFGIGRATTKFVSEQIAQQDTEGARQTAWTSLAALTFFGVIGGISLALLNRPLTEHVLLIPVPLRGESSDALTILAVSIPLLLASTGARGVLEAQGRFGIINAIRIPVGVGTVVAPLLVVRFSPDLGDIAAALLLIRALDCAVMLLACRMTLPELGRPKMPHAKVLTHLAAYGGWLTVTSVVGPLMTYLDRFIVGGMVSMSAVAYYSTPYDVVTKQLLIPASLIGVVFPALAACAAVAPARFVELYDRTVAYLIIVMTPAALLLLLLAGPALEMWLGGQFARNSTVVVQLLAVGVLLNAIAQAPYAAIQALGRPDLTAKLHMVELPLYLFLLQASVSAIGITGAALAWLVRAGVDAALLFLICNRILPCRSSQTASAAVLGGSAGFLLLSGWLCSRLLTGLLPKVVILACVAAPFVAASVRILRRHRRLPAASDQLPGYGETVADRPVDEVVSHV